MSSQSRGRRGDPEQSFTLDEENTFSFVPGPMLAVTCPSCFKNQLLKEVVARGSCTSCGADLELTLTARTD